MNHSKEKINERSQEKESQTKGCHRDPFRKADLCVCDFLFSFSGEIEIFFSPKIIHYSQVSMRGWKDATFIQWSFAIIQLDRFKRFHHSESQSALYNLNLLNLLIIIIIISVIIFVLDNVEKTMCESMNEWCGKHSASSQSIIRFCFRLIIVFHSVL